jgi:hypothetical protein
LQRQKLNEKYFFFRRKFFLMKSKKKILFAYLKDGC